MDEEVSGGSQPSAEEILRLARDEGVEFVHLQFTDIPGAIKGVSIPVERLEACLNEGVWFDGSSIEGLARLAESDLYLLPDRSTFALLPWERVKTARVICDLRAPDGAPFVADPRYVLQRALLAAAERGYAYRVGAEVEFYLFEENSARGEASARAFTSSDARDFGLGRGAAGIARALVPPDQRGYFEEPVARASEVGHETAKALRSLGYRVSASHHEVSPGQYEIDLAEDDALRTADAIVALKLTARTLAGRFGLIPTFMPKPKTHASGSGLHLGQVLTDRRSGTNVLFDSVEPGGLSREGEWFIAGQLGHARGMCALLAPLVNSYKRLVGGAEAPARVTWARFSPGAFIRVPEARTRLAESVEVRAADPSCNPYLALAALLQTGLSGIDNQAPLPAPAEYAPGDEARPEEAADLLPSTLGEALEELGWDMTVREALGQSVFERFLVAKEQEWSAYRHHVSDWELETYLETA